MLWIFLTIVATVVAFGWGLGKNFWRGLINAFSALVAGTIVTLFANLLLSPVVSHSWHEYARADIVNLKESSSLSGNFFFGSGIIKDTPSFVYYERHKDGSITLEHQDADIVSVIESNEPPHVEYYENRSDNKLMSLARDLDDNKYKVKIIIPPGSVVTNYKLGD